MVRLLTLGPQVLLTLTTLFSIISHLGPQVLLTLTKHFQFFSGTFLESTDNEHENDKIFHVELHFVLIQEKTSLEEYLQACFQECHHGFA